MIPTQAIESLDGMVAEVQQCVDRLSCQARDITAQWEALERVGAGRREDHAAALLKRLQDPLTHLQRYVGRCALQLEMICQEEG